MGYEDSNFHQKFVTLIGKIMIIKHIDNFTKIILYFMTFFMPNIKMVAAYIIVGKYQTRYSQTSFFVYYNHQ